MLIKKEKNNEIILSVTYPMDKMKKGSQGPEGKVILAMRKSCCELNKEYTVLVRRRNSADRVPGNDSI